MTINKAIKIADTLRPNAIERAMKVEWVQELNSQIAEFMGMDVPKIKEEDPANLPNDFLDEDLLLPAPYDSVYYLYLMAMINDGQEETSLYANDMTVFNNAMSQAKAWWRRNNKHPHRRDRVKGVWRH